MTPDELGPTQQIHRLLVANRGEIAVRVMRTAQDMGIECVTVYSDADRDALHVEVADLAVHLPGTAAVDTYLRSDLVVAAALATDCTAVHPGYGFLSENAEFAEAVQAAGLLWVGPQPDAIRSMGNKIAARQVASAAGLPLAAELDPKDPAALDPALYPVIVKAAAGGGGKGMRLVADPADLADAVAAAQREAAASFGDDSVYIEQYLEHSRHVEVQVFGDQHGNVLHLFDRECSIQRRHQKVVEEAPSPGLTQATRENMTAAAVNLAQEIEYAGAGTVEFLVSGDGDQQRFYFLEMNTRLQVEHRVTELITGTDLVQWQLLVASGLPFTVDQDELEVDGHALEVRVYAEDPNNDYLPSSGLAERIKLSDPVALVDAGYQSGDEISPHYDPLIAKVVTHGQDRDDATTDMQQALAAACVTGVTTNLPLLRNIVGSLAFSVGDTTTDFLANHPELVGGGLEPTPAQLLAGMVAALLQDGVAVDSLTAPAWRNVPADSFAGFRLDDSSTPIWLRYRTDRDGWVVSVSPAERPFGESVPEHRYRVKILPGQNDSGRRRLLLESDGITKRIDTWANACGVVVREGQAWVTLLPVAAGGEQAAGQGAAGSVAPVPGTVTTVLVAPGESVVHGQALVTIEAMKMEHTVSAAGAGVVAEVLVSPGATVAAHQQLVVLKEET